MSFFTFGGIVTQPSGALQDEVVLMSDQAKLDLAYHKNSPAEQKQYE